MLINATFYIGHESDRDSEGRVLLESLRAYLTALGKPEEHNANEIKAVADLTLTLFEGVLAHTEQLCEYSEPDGEGGYQTCYRPLKLTETIAREGRAE